MSARDYPERPFLAASTALFRDGLVLLAARGTGHAAGVYSLPGGMVELGETPEQAALRELMEETGVAASIAGFVCHTSVIHFDAAKRVKFHALVCVFAALWVSGEPHVTAETSDIRWIRPGRLGGLPVTTGLPDVLKQAEAVISRSR